ncbi:MAG: BlaI/MecI/CopY family transcriptional regulator [Pirellulaceae bacterium]|jgi:predicted transcriptional regulator|nr:BlaI/MecI/CopY family transcriptional regulator [Pirellulaceae bacterium]MCU0979334.1 BlaI/MecI/CopY family transcriptional regulator [Pirellulaceae bacterium]
MARPPNAHPTDGELELLQVLWQAGPCSLGQICTALRLRRPIATTTVATILKTMLAKKLVVRKNTPQGYLWSANTTRQNAATGLVGKLVDLVFDGSAHRLVAHLLESDQLSDQEREDLRRLIDTGAKAEK